jgi:hypothetical protein
MSTKTPKELLKTFLQNNKVRREKLAKSIGYESAEAYINFLKGVDAKLEIFIAPTPARPMDIVIAFDTTGSMRSYIEGVRNHVRELVGELFKNTPNLKMKIVAFGDYCDMESKDVFGKAYQETQLTDNQNDLIDFVNKAKNTGGGDSDEFYELVIKKITNETPWRDGSKSVLLIGDANPHQVGYGGHKISWKEEAIAASKLGIQFDTLRIHQHVSWYKELSEITNGICSDFKNAEKISEVIKGATYSRGGEKTKVMFMRSMDAAVESGDKEVIAMYKGMSKNIITKK